MANWHLTLSLIFWEYSHAQGLLKLTQVLTKQLKARHFHKSRGLKPRKAFLSHLAKKCWAFFDLRRRARTFCQLKSKIEMSKKASKHIFAEFWRRWRRNKQKNARTIATFRLQWMKQKCSSNQNKLRRCHRTRTDLLEIRKLRTRQK